MNLRKDRDILDTTQLVVTILTAGFALFLNFQQGILSRRIQREGITQTYVDKILGYVEKLVMDPALRDAIVIDMLDIITEANLNTGEKPYGDSERQQLIPLRLALATRNHDLIAHIGTSPDKRSLWTNTAVQSGNDEIKRTAIRALAQIGRYRARDEELETFRFCIEKILDISEDFARAPISEDAMQQFTILVEVARKVPSLLEDPPLKALMQRGRDALILVAGRAIKEGVEEQQPEQPEPPPDPKPAALYDPARGGEMDELQRVTNREIRPVRAARWVHGSDEGPPLFLMTSVFNSAQKALKQMDHLNLKKEADKPLSPNDNNLSSLIAALKDDDVVKRRNARQVLAKGGAANVAPLLAALRKEPTEYRMKVGVTFSLSKMSDPVAITNAADATLLVQLAGDEDAEVRQYASEFLIRRSDSESIRTIIPQLQVLITRELAATAPNGNAVYNAVVILGTWMRTLPSALKDEKDAITQYLRELKPQLPNDNSWGKKTLGLINELAP